MPDAIIIENLHRRAQNLDHGWLSLLLAHPSLFTGVIVLLDQLLRGVAEQLVLKHLGDHRVSPGRRRDEETLKKLVAFVWRQLLVQKGELIQTGHADHD